MRPVPVAHTLKRRGHRTPAFTGRIRKRKKKSLLLLGGLLLGSWLLSSVLLRGHVGLPPSPLIRTRQMFWSSRVRCFVRKVSRLASGRRLCDGNTSSDRIRDVVILETMCSCQWNVQRVFTRLVTTWTHEEHRKRSDEDTAQPVDVAGPARIFTRIEGRMRAQAGHCSTTS